MAHSVEHGSILDLPSEPTLSDASAGGLEAGSLTFDVCQKLVDEFALIDEVSIARAIQHMVTEEKLVVEGAAAVAVAALIKRHETKGDIGGKTVVVVICGGNISAETLSDAMVV